jgi:hypothetical protein
MDIPVMTTGQLWDQLCQLREERPEDWMDLEIFLEFASRASHVATLVMDQVDGLEVIEQVQDGSLLEGSVAQDFDTNGAHTGECFRLRGIELDEFAAPPVPEGLLASAAGGVTLLHRLDSEAALRVEGDSLVMGRYTFTLGRMTPAERLQMTAWGWYRFEDSWKFEVGGAL